MVVVVCFIFPLCTTSSHLGRNSPTGLSPYLRDTGLIDNCCGSARPTAEGEPGLDHEPPSKLVSILPPGFLLPLLP